MNFIIKTSILIAFLSASSTAFADENVRLIVTKTDGSSAVQEEGRSLLTSESVFVPEELVASTISELYKDKNVVIIERDVTVHPTGSLSPLYPYAVGEQSVAENAPNDPSFDYQSYFLPRVEAGSEDDFSNARLAGSNILEAWAQGEQKSRPKIAVMDGGFLEEGTFADIQPVYNYSFVDDSQSSVGDSAWSSVEEMECENGHGVGVYSVVGAISNNNLHVAGIVDADMYMLQVMRCGSGSLYNSANSLRWAAGGVIDGVPTLDEPVDIATFSLGSRVDRCPVFMQEAINFAVSKGVKVFMAAGNDNDTTTGFAPANCENVTVTAGMDANTGDKASFSNYDDKIDVIAQGTQVGALANVEGDVGLWDGTSFAGPISAGVYGLAMAHAPSLSDELLSQLMNATLATLENTPECDALGCGEGLVDAGAFVRAAINYEEGSFGTVQSALSETALCDMTPYLMASGVKSRLCNAYSVSLDADMFTSRKDDIVTYQLYQWANGENLDTTTTTPVFESAEADFLINGLDMNKQAGVVRCVNGQCDNSLVLPVLLGDTGRPDVCDE
jgi:hypothetical protein